MRRLGETPRCTFSFDTCLYRGRYISFLQDEGNLCVAETTLGETVEFIATRSKVRLEKNDAPSVCCCVMGGAILVLGKSKKSVVAILATIDGGGIKDGKIVFMELRVEGMDAWGGLPFIRPFSPTHALVGFAMRDGLWTCDLDDGKVIMRPVDIRLPGGKKLRAPPAPLPDGRMIAAGTDPASTDIFLVTDGETPTFEKVADIPNSSAFTPSLLLLKDRFVLGFGGRDGDEDLWILDTLTYKTSLVRQEGEWHPSDLFYAPMGIQDESLYIFGHSVAVISLRTLSRLILDDEVRSSFCQVLKLPEVRLSLPPRMSLEGCSGMKELSGSTPFSLFNTVRYKGRTFFFAFMSKSSTEITAAEVCFGERMSFIATPIKIPCGAHRNSSVSCCLLGDKILVVTGSEGGSALARAVGGGKLDLGALLAALSSSKEDTSVFAALVEIGDGLLRPESLRATKLNVELVGKVSWPNVAFFAPISESRVWVSFESSNTAAMLELEGETLRVKMLESEASIDSVFGTVPLRLPNGKFLVMGGWPWSDNIVYAGLTPEDKLFIEPIGKIPGDGRHGASCIVLGERFAVGFGGFFDPSPQKDLWVFDLQTRKASSAKQRGEWPPGEFLSYLEVRDNILYILGGAKRRSIHCISLAAFCELLENDEVKTAFRAWLEMPSPLNKEIDA